VSSGSGSGSGADQHLLALLRAIRLRQAAPDAVAAGVADTAAALTDPDSLGQGERPGLPASAQPPRPGWAMPHEAHADEAHADEAHADEAHADEAHADEAHADEDDPAGAEPATPQEFAPETTADFFGRPTTGPVPADKAGTSEGPADKAAASDEPADKAAASEPPGPGKSATAESSRDKPGAMSPFDHGPQLRPRGLPPLGPRRHTGGDIDAPGGPAALDRPGRAGNDLAPAPPGAGPMRAVEGTGAGPVRSGGSAAARLTKGEGAGPVPSAEDALSQLRGHAEPLPPAPHSQVAGIGRIGAAIDGMDPADDALLRETQRLLSTSLTFAGGPGEVAERFRAALARAEPTLLAALPGNAATQAEQLARGLTWLVHHLDQPPKLVTGCGLLGAALAECGVRPYQLQLVAAALAEAIRSGMPAGAWRQDFDLAWRSTWQHAYEWIVHGETLTQYQPTVWTAVVVEHELRRHDLAVIRLRPYLPMPFRPGQYARVEVPEVPGVWRPYSLAGKPRRDDLIELHVRAKTRSGVSGTLVYSTEVGDHVRLSRAEGNMGIPSAPDRNLLMIAGDTGVAPLKALLAELADTGDPRSAVLFWGVRNLDELYDIDEIADIARAARRATVVPVVSEGDPGPYASGLVTEAVAAYGEWSGHEVYLAGPPLMLAATSAALRLLGVAPDHIHHDAPE
jgi:NAD(P)H-flavin reductase